MRVLCGRCKDCTNLLLYLLAIALFLAAFVGLAYGLDDMPIEKEYGYING